MSSLSCGFLIDETVLSQASSSWKLVDVEGLSLNIGHDPIRNCPNLTGTNNDNNDNNNKLNNNNNFNNNNK